MLKALAVLRTAYLVFIVGYTVRAMPFVTTVARTFDEQYAICSSSLHVLVRAAWLAIAWIAFETVVGWLLARRRPAPVPVTPPPSTSTSTSPASPGSTARPPPR
ncbi:MAG: hypothetical protein ACJ79E_09605 [Anaeromyxobacteraceae bacterium]